MDLNPVQEEYSRLAPHYDHRWSFYVNASIQATIRRLQLNAYERILDLGCGTGTLIQYLLKLAPDVDIVGIDCSLEMLSMARQKLPESVELLAGSVDQIPFPDANFDRIISTSAFHYFRHVSQSIQEMQRVLKPGGHLIITDWCKDYWTCFALDRYLRFTNTAHVHTYGAHELQTILKQEGFQDVLVETYKINWFWGMMSATAIK